jgi:mannitol-1-phosphate 5-dehydrogenase
MKDGEPMRVCVERYGYLPTDKAAFKGEVPEIKNMVPFEPFDFYIKRKLYVHNMGHATCAYLGDLLGLEYIYQSIDVADVRILVQNAMLESALALSGKYGVALGDVVLHITDLLNRFTNAALKDTCARVGGDPARKLSPDDRMIGSSSLALQQGTTPAYIAVGAAAGVHRYIKEAEGMEQGLDAAKQVLADVSKLDVDGELAKMILAMYEKILSGATVADLRRAADALKASTLKPIV